MSPPPVSDSISIFTPAWLADRTLHRRAVEAVIWGMPVVNFDLLYQAMVRTVGGAFNQIVYWSRLSDWKNQTLTPNPDAIYLMPFIDTSEVGPVVLEIPSADEGSITGSVMDCWQAAIEDVGPAGVDKGLGGRYLILPPGYEQEVPGGYIPLASGNYRGYALLRSILRSGGDAGVAQAVAYAKRVKLYPLSRPGPTTFVDAINVVFDATITYDGRFFQSLNRMVQAEPWLTRDRVMIDMLRTIGIEKGKPFQPDAKLLEVFRSAAQEAHAWLASKYDSAFAATFFDGEHWAAPASAELVKGFQSTFADPSSYPLDARGLAFSSAFFSAKNLGTGHYYLMAIRDKEGEVFHGRNTYRLHVPANAPVNQYWSATAYDRATHALIRDMPYSSRSSQNPELQPNPDGSTDIYFGTRPPEGKRSNWVPTKEEGDFEVLFRLYGPEPALFEKTWVLPDIEKVSLL